MISLDGWKIKYQDAVTEQFGEEVIPSKILMEHESGFEMELDEYRTGTLESVLCYAMFKMADEKYYARDYDGALDGYNELIYTDECPEDIREKSIDQRSMVAIKTKTLRKVVSTNGFCPYLEGTNLSVRYLLEVVEKGATDFQIQAAHPELNQSDVYRMRQRHYKMMKKGSILVHKQRIRIDDVKFD